MSNQNNLFDDGSDQEDYDYDDDNYRPPQQQKRAGGALRSQGTFFNSKKSATGACQKGCFLLLRKFFSWLYPRRARKTRNNHSDWLRAYIGWSLVLHMFFFVISLIFVGFWPMIMNLLLATWAYSCYLTLRTSQIFFYICFLISAIFCVFDDLWNENMLRPYNSVQKMGLITQGVCYGCLIFWNSKMFWKFYVLGGLKAHRSEEPLLGEKIVGAAVQGTQIATAKLDDELSNAKFKENAELAEGDRRALL